MYKGRWECIRLRDAGSGQGYKTCPVDSGRSLDGEGRELWGGGLTRHACRRLPQFSRRSSGGCHRPLSRCDARHTPIRLVADERDVARLPGMMLE